MYDFHIVLDFEMNPVAKKIHGEYADLKNEIVEIGAVKLDSELNIVDSFRSFVKPEHNRQITPKISRLTGISTSSALNADTFAPVLARFVEWIGGEGKIRIYSWSDTDFLQLRNECEIKSIPFPDNMRRWLDFQKVFPRMMNIANDRRAIALKEAAKYFGIAVDGSKAHDALYDAEITAQILIPFLDGEYKNQVQCLYSFTHDDEDRSTLGDSCGGVLAELLRQMQSE